MALVACTSRYFRLFQFGQVGRRTVVDQPTTVQYWLLNVVQRGENPQAVATPPPRLTGSEVIAWRFQCDIELMSVTIGIEELLGYTQGERDKWEGWFQVNKLALGAAVQSSGQRFPTVWSLVDHIFLVEKRHTQRLKQESPLAVSTGVTERDTDALFAYARSVRTELEPVAHAMAPAEAARVIELDFGGRRHRFTARKLLFHILFHETRHWAQIATAVRNADFEPPGFHDLLFTAAME